MTSDCQTLSFRLLQIKFKIKFQIPKNNPYWKFQEILDSAQHRGNIYFLFYIQIQMCRNHSWKPFQYIESWHKVTEDYDMITLVLQYNETMIESVRVRDALLNNKMSSLPWLPSHHYRSCTTLLSQSHSVSTLSNYIFM